jgi:hypothetical protein
MVLNSTDGKGTVVGDAVGEMDTNGRIDSGGDANCQESWGCQLRLS